MQKLSFNELCRKIDEHNEKNGITRQYEDKKPLKCVVVFKAENWPDKDYTEISRAYEFRSDNKYFLHEMLGNSWYADCMDGSDQDVRLDWYNWKIDYCFIKQSRYY